MHYLHANCLLKLANPRVDSADVVERSRHHSWDATESKRSHTTDWQLKKASNAQQRVNTPTSIDRIEDNEATVATALELAKAQGHIHSITA